MNMIETFWNYVACEWLQLDTFTLTFVVHLINS